MWFLFGRFVVICGLPPHGAQASAVDEIALIMSCVLPAPLPKCSPEGRRMCVGRGGGGGGDCVCVNAYTSILLHYHPLIKMLLRCVI